jgi:acetyl esterase/lipase
MTIPRWLADTIARLVQKAPGSPRLAPDVAFTEFPALTEEITIPTRHGEVRAIQYQPSEGQANNGVYINLHGGGFVLRHPEQDDAICRYIAANADVTVLNIDYTPAPQLRFPGPVEQAYDVAAWAAAPERPWDGSRLAIGGQSAGGALAAGAARLALEIGAPRISLQVLMYPPLDLTVTAKSKKTAGKETFLARMGPVFDTAYCPDERQRSDQLASPAGRGDRASLTGIAPALLITGGKDILRDEGARYGARLQAVDALIEHLDLPDVGHGFNILGAPREVVLPVYEKIAEATRHQLKLDGQ